MANTTQIQVANIILALAAAVEAWRTPNNAGAVIADAMTAMSALDTLDPNLANADVARVLTTSQQSLAALEAGQPAIGPTITVSLNGKSTRVALFGVVEDSEWAKQNLGL